MADIENGIGGAIAEMTPTEARTQIKSTMSEAAKDPTHPYMDGSNIGHKDEVERMTALFAQANPEPEAQTNAEGQELSNPIPVEQYNAMENALEIQSGKDTATQEKLKAQVEEDVEILTRDFDYEVDSIPDDLTPDLAGLIRMQRLTAQEDFTTLRPMLKQFSRYIPAQNAAVINQFLDLEDIDPVAKKEITQSFLASLNRARKQVPEKKGFGAA